MNKDEFYSELTKLGIELNEKQKEDFNKYYLLLTSWNKKFNLTSILEENDVYLKHFYDSCCLIKSDKLKDKLTLCDIGTGAGFPGLVIAIIKSNINITLIESNGKKCTFLKEVKNELNLSNVEIINNRAENFSKINREKFDLITCRAVSDLSVLLELTIPALKVNGYFIPLKASLDEELTNAQEKIKKLDCVLESVITYDLPNNQGKRNIPIILKKKETNKIYPRDYSKIIKDLKKY